MCGLFGIVDADRGLGPEASAAAERMRQALAHRGPDGWGLVSIGAAAIEMRRADGPPARRPRMAPAPHAALLGHQRLAVIDLTDGGHQPRATPDGRFWITYNGEVYNYRELRRELEDAGVSFESASDTEVVLALYVREGPRALERLRGMFAFAVWDDLDGTLFLARDRFGMKPLVWAEPRPGALIFASEPKACLASGLVPADVDPATEVRFLRRGYLPAGASAYRALRPLAPGHWLRWTRGRVVTGAYWSLPAALGGGPWQVAAAEDAAQAFEAALTESVRAHLVSDVPVGIFLSGGLDSTAVLAAARRVSAGALRTFTVTCPGMPEDERTGARAAAARFETDHTEVAVTRESVFATLDRFFAAMDEPTADGLNTFVVAQAAREAGLKVVLSGLGGDELLGGYPSFVVVPRLLRCVRALQVVPGLRRVAAEAAEQVLPSLGPKLAAILRDAPCEIEEVWRRYRALFTERQVRAITGSRPDETPLEVADQDGSPEVARAGGASLVSAGARGDDVARRFWRIVRCEMEEFMTPQLLRDADQFTMTWGLELRTPLVDHELVAAMRRVGAWRRRSGCSYKATLFAAAPGLVPARAARGPKRGFFLPLDRWLREELSTPAPRDEGFAALRREPRYRAVVDAFLRGRLHWSRPWALYVLERVRQRAGGCDRAGLSDPLTGGRRIRRWISLSSS